MGENLELALAQLFEPVSDIPITGVDAVDLDKLLSSLVRFADRDIQIAELVPEAQRLVLGDRRRVQAFFVPFDTGFLTPSTTVLFLPHIPNSRCHF